MVRWWDIHKARSKRSYFWDQIKGLKSSFWSQVESVSWKDMDVLQLNDPRGVGVGEISGLVSANESRWMMDTF